MMSLAENLMYLYGEDEEFLLADGFDDACIGVDEKTMRVIYSVQKCIDILRMNHEMDEASAFEYFEFNVSGAYVGDKTPIWCYDLYLVSKES